MRRAHVVVVFVLVLVAVIGPGGSAAGRVSSGGAAGAAATVTVRADFNDDGAADLAVGAPFEGVGSVGEAGTVIVLFGSPGGLAGPGSQLFNQESAGIASAAEVGDHFGYALAAGDFDADGFTDLAVGAPGESVGTVPSAGVVEVLYGSSGGLTGVGSQLWTQDTPRLDGRAESFDGFGSSLAAGDFNGDGADDLGVGASFERVGTVEGAGSVHVLYGTPTGLTGVGSQLFTQAGRFVGSEPEPLDRFGWALAAGDLNGDGFADLAVGASGEAVGAVVAAGAVNVLFGSANNLTVIGSQLVSQETPGVGSTAELNDRFGSALAAGDFNGGGFVDLAVGAPGEGVGTIEGAGAVIALPGSAGGLRATSSQLFTQDTAGVGSTAEFFDAFGDALAAGDFNGDGPADLAVGVPFESVGTVEAAGAVNVLPGSAARLTGTGSQLFTQDTAGVGSTAEEADQFGSALAAGDFNGDGPADLAVGVPFEAVGTVEGAGAANVLPGSAAMLTGTGSQLFTQDTAGVGSTAEAADLFGFSLAAADSG